MTIWTILGVVSVAAFLASLLRKTNPEQAMLLTLAAGAVIVMAVLSVAVPALSRVTALLGQVSVGAAHTDVLLKAIGICLLTQTAADVCRDAGETALAGKAESAGKVLLLVCALPLFEEAASLLTGMIGGQAVGG